ncbi:MAG TPA: hypothetical protein VGG73_12730 [Vicinamibacterales bacterium]
MLVLAVLLVCIPTREARGQAAAIPLSLGLTTSNAEVTVGGTATVTVALKNFSDTLVGATQPITVSLRSDLSDTATTAFSTGQKTAQVELHFIRPGVARIEATAQGFGAGFAIVVVKDPAASAAAEKPVPAPLRVVPKAVAAAPAGSAPAPTTATGAALDVTVLPQHVHASHSSWHAQVLLTAIKDGEPAAVKTDTDVYLATDIGLVTPAMSKIVTGQARTSEPIQLTSTTAGSGTVWAWTDTGRVTEVAVDYHEAVPVQLVVKALPLRDVNDGSTPVTVTIFLQDDSAIGASADRDIPVDLITTSGTLNPRQVLIAKGAPFAEASLTSAASGDAQITAHAAGFVDQSASVTFVMPWMLVLTAAVGGFLGALVGTGTETFSAAWWHQMIGHILTGALIGLVFYVLALFGIIASIPAASIPLERLPTTNALGALVLGFFGGLWGRSWLPKPNGSRTPTPPPASAAP